MRSSRARQAFSYSPVSQYTGSGRSSIPSLGHYSRAGSVSLMGMDLTNRAMLQQELQEMNELVNRGAELTKQLLGFAHRDKNVVRVLNVNESLTRNSKIFGRAHKNIIFHHDFTDATSTVLADEAQLDQVFLNLLLNAGLAMPDGTDFADAIGGIVNG